jgi:DNA sulfur modification protein DndC
VYFAFSGGKDSSAALKLLYTALRQTARPARTRVTIIYVDTGVDIPVVTQMVRRTLRHLSAEAKNDRIPLQVKCVRPQLSDRYLVKVIGRGYPPPSSIFRWCTDVLRIDPIRRFLQRTPDSGAITVVGIRRGESENRDRLIHKHATSSQFYQKQVDSVSNVLFCPIINYSLNDVWETLRCVELPRAINTPALLEIYKDASAECPVIRETKGAPCGRSRFGCWTCTVVRRNRAVESLVDGVRKANYTSRVGGCHRSGSQSSS